MKFFNASLIFLVFSFALNAQQHITDVVNNALVFAQKQSLILANKYKNDDKALPRTFEHGVSLHSNAKWWTSGFFPGVLWYLYEADKNDSIKYYAQLYSKRVEDEKYTTDNHDVGFMLYCSFGNGLRLTNNPDYREVLLTGANSLSKRYNPNVGLIRSWDFYRHKWQYPVIIDNMMNLELMMWAAKNGGGDRFRKIALSHANKTMKHHFRNDYSSYHLVSYDTLTALPHHKQTWQGYNDASSWSRGQSWGLYGFTMMYRETKNKKYLNHAKAIANYLINHPNMPADYIPYWDYNAPNIPNELRDASAATVMASALTELSKYVGKGLKKKYLDVVETQIRTLSSPAYTAQLGANGGFILKHSVGSLPTKSEVDVPLTYADYYYVEALLRFKELLEKSCK